MFHLQACTGSFTYFCGGAFTISFLLYHHDLEFKVGSVLLFSSLFTGGRSIAGMFQGQAVDQESSGI